MALCQVDFGKRVAWDGSPSGWYYWSSVYYLDDDDFVSPVQMCTFLNGREEPNCTEDVQFTRCVVKRPPGRTNVIYTHVWSFPQFGGLASEGEYSLINAVRIRWRSSTGRLSWRLQRQPLRPSDMDGAQLSSSGLAWANAGANYILAPERCRNSYGELLVSKEVVRPLMMWQLRHGTKRRDRDPLA